MRPANPARVRRSPSARRGKCVRLRDRRDPLARAPGDPLAGSDAGLHDRLDARDLAGDDVAAALGLALDRADLTLGARAVAADEALGLAATAAQLALEPGARLAHVALELVAGGVAAALQLGDPLLGALASRRHVAQLGYESDGAIARLERGADVHERGALGDVAALLGGRLHGADVGLGGLARLVGRDRAVATSGRLRRRLGGRGAAGSARRGLARSRLASGALALGRGGLRGGRGGVLSHLC